MMSNENEFLTLLEHLPVEIFLQIFALLSLREIITTFSGLNSNIDSIIRSVRDKDHVVRYNDTDAINLLQLFPTQIGRLALVNVEGIDLTSLIHLRSLTLKYGNLAQFNTIHPRYFPMLEILHIKGLHTTVNGNTITINNLFQVILSNGFPRLRICTAFDIGALAFRDTWTGSSSLRFLNLNMKTTEDCGQLLSVCPHVIQLTTYESSSGISQTEYSGPGNKRLLNEFRKLERLESENKFILDINPTAFFGHDKLPPQFNNSTTTPRHSKERTTTILGRILPQTEPYCRASFLIQITLPPEYPFKAPEIMLLDPVYHPYVEESGKCCCDCLGFGDSRTYRSTTSLSDFIIAIIHVIDSVPNSHHSHSSKRFAEYQNNHQKFYKKALELTLTYGRPRY